ncbi:hypothetical protein DUNSADRAFT_1230 [Dunaliella salina]|uniref:Uncharacterized protein n=1 Tax=Dunaliella salina TaxID=3046 RepID=A0ABQ7FXV0_DUNSA|nr:hypothetical protein DUNSADRAFT_1230 [Dunaliella salina]|eukprot:KAF5827168.1 hypothetical protein DUNSADRAFT_1230 [Dunaliella salina]
MKSLLWSWGEWSVFSRPRSAILFFLLFNICGLSAQGRIQPHHELILLILGGWSVFSRPRSAILFFMLFNICGLFA